MVSLNSRLERNEEKKSGVAVWRPLFMGRHGVQLLAQTRGVLVTEAGSYLRLIDSCITHLEAPGPFRTCNDSKEE